MPKLSMDMPHELGRDEAVRRLKEKFDHARTAYGGHLNDLQEQWTDGALDFSFSAVGMNIAGKILVEDQSVKLDADLPLGAMMFRGMIEQRIRQEVGDLLV